MKEFADSRGMECRFLSLNDSRELHRMSVGEREFVFTGCEHGKTRLAATAVRAARRHAKLVLAAHPNLAPVVLAMKVVAPRVKTIVCTHGVEVWEPLPLLRRRALRRSDLVLAPSQNTADHVAEMQDIAPARIRVLPWALDPQFETLVAQARAPLPANFPRADLHGDGSPRSPRPGLNTSTDATGLHPVRCRLNYGGVSACCR